MSYERFIRKRGKVYGPYIYESYRDENGVVRKRYLGKAKRTKNRIWFFAFILLVVFFFSFLKISYTTKNLGSGNLFPEPFFTFEKKISSLTGLIVSEKEETNAPDTAGGVKKEEIGKKEEKGSKDRGEPEKKESKDLTEDKEQKNEDKGEDEPQKKEKDVGSKGSEKDKEEKTSKSSGENEGGVSVEPGSEEDKFFQQEKTENKSSGRGEVENKSGGEKELENKSIRLAINESEIVEKNESEIVEKPNESNVLVSANKSKGLEGPIGANESFESLSTNISNISNFNVSGNINQSENLSLINRTNLKILQYRAVVGRPVKWIKKINVSKEGLLVKLPKGAKNITIITDAEIDRALEEAKKYEEKVKKVERKKIASGKLTGHVSLDIQEGHGIFFRLLEWLRSFTVSGRVISEQAIKDKVVNGSNETLVDLSSIALNPNSTDIAVEYYTDPPQIAEEVSGRGKEITVYAADELNYTDILAYTTIDWANVSVGDKRLKLYWNVGNSSILVNYTAYDLNNDSFVDYIEWVVPHLSNQSYSLVIEITAAEHLDSQRNFISDIFNETRALDGNWSEPIYAGEYVRVTFERKLSSKNDITVFPRAGNGTNLSDVGLEVYLFNGTEKIAEFPIFDSGSRYYKVLLSEMNGTHDVFDLRVFSRNGKNVSVEFDHIIDPNSAPTIDSLSIQSTSGYGTTDDNLTVSFTASDADGDAIYNVTDWRKNGVSIATLNMPFNTNVSDSSSALVKDYSTYKNNGTLSGNTNPLWTNVSCQSGGCYKFDGTDDYIRVPDASSISGLGAITVSVWINASQWKSACLSGICEERIIQKGSFDPNLGQDWEYILYHYEDGAADEVRWFVSSDGLSPQGPDSYASYSTSNLNTNTWYHLVGVWSDSGLDLYVNGAKVSSALSPPISMNDGAGNLGIGSSGDNGGQGGDDDFDGMIDEVMIFDRALSAAEIKELYDSGSYKYLKKIVSAETNGGENWSVAVTASDLKADSSTNLSSNITLLSTGTNVWNCTSWQNFDNASCWTLGRVPNAGDNVRFNGTYTGSVNVTNNTMPQGLASFTVESGYSGTIYFQPLFAVGDWTGNNDGTQEWNVTGDINISGGEIKVYGDVRHKDFYSGAVGNKTSDGHGQIWRSISGDIIIGGSAVINGTGLGFGAGEGPGRISDGACYAGFRNYFSKLNCRDKVYGNATAPTSLGTGANSSGGSAVELDAAGNVTINGKIYMEGEPALSSGEDSGTGGSIWVLGDWILGTGRISTAGGRADRYPGTGGRVRLGYRSSKGLNFTGYLATGGQKSVSNNEGNNSDPGTLTFTNNTWPRNWTVNGTIGLLGGDFGDGAVLNVLGDFYLGSGYDIEVYGDYVSGSNHWNTSVNGSGLWLNVSGNVSISSGVIIDGWGNGFPAATGPGAGSNTVGATHGGKGYNSNKEPYGDYRSPTSLGSGAEDGGGGGAAIKVTSKSLIVVDGSFLFGAHYKFGVQGSSAGGSVWLDAPAVDVTGTIDVEQFYYGGGGRIAITGENITIPAGAVEAYSGVASGGTIYINATKNLIINESSGVRVYGDGGDGGNITLVGNYTFLNGTYRANGGTNDGRIDVYFEDCDLSDTSQADADPALTIHSSGCDITAPSIRFVKPSYFTGAAVSGSFTMNASANDTGSNVSLFFDYDNTAVGWWRMNDIRGLTVVDELGKHNGTIEQNVTEVRGGRFGSAAHFDGDMDAINIGNVLPSASYFTISAWVKSNTTGKIVSNRWEKTEFFDDFSTDKGWSGYGGNGEWNRSALVSNPATCAGGSKDPTTDHSPSGDNYVLGNDVGGCYNAGLTQTYNITSPTIDCSNCQNTNLSFWRYLGVEGTNDKAYVFVYDGSAWQQVFASGSTTISDTKWAKYEYNISSYADGNSNLKIRFGIGPTDSLNEYFGWNIDDLRIYHTNVSGQSKNPVYLSTEGGGKFVVTDSNGVSEVRYNATLNDSRWHHIVGVVKEISGLIEKSIRIYIDGSLKNSTTSNGGVTSPTSDNFYIGDMFYGDIDDVLIFNRTLNDAEIYALYEQGKSRFLNATKSPIGGDRTYNYRAYSQDLSGNVNSTSLWNFLVDSAKSYVVFGSPTPANNSIWTNMTLPINLTASDSSTNISAFVDIDNKTLGWWRFENKFNSSFSETTVACDQSGFNHRIGFTSIVPKDNDKVTFNAGPENGNTYTASSCQSGDCGMLSSEAGCCELSGWTGCTGSPDLNFDYSVTVLNGTILKDYTDNRNFSSSTSYPSDVEILYGRLGNALNLTWMQFELTDISWSSSDSFAISLWLWPDDSSKKGAVVSKVADYEFSLHVGDGNDIVFEYWNSTGYPLINLTAENNLSLGSWHHAVVSYNGSVARLYVDGVLADSDSDVSGTLKDSSGNLVLGQGYYNTTDYGAFSGVVDDLIIFNRSLSEAEVFGLYANSSSKEVLANITNIGLGNHSYRGYSQDYAGNLNNTGTRIIQVNNTPTTPTVNINSSSGLNRTADDLYCKFTAIDPDGDKMTVWVDWNRDGQSRVVSQIYSNVNNNTKISSKLLSGDTSKGETWICQVTIGDGYSNSSTASSPTLTIQNTPPTVTLEYPADASKTTNRTPLFNWTYSDDDGDAVNFTWNISVVKFSGSGSCSDTRSSGILTENNYTPKTDLKCLYDNGFYYVWQVNATDGTDWTMSSVYSFNLTALVNINLANSVVDFGEIAQYGSNDTTDDSPPPFVLENNGTVFVDVDINSTQLWSTVPGNSSYYQFKVDNVSGEEGAFNWTGSITNWYNFSISGAVTAIDYLNYSDATDSAEVDVRVQTPPNEGAGTKSGTVTFTASLGE